MAETSLTILKAGTFVFLKQSLGSMATALCGLTGWGRRGGGGGREELRKGWREKEIWLKFHVERRDGKIEV